MRRPFAIGNKNWQFAGSERAGYRAAAIQSVFALPTPNELDSAGGSPHSLDNLLTCVTARSTYCYRSQTSHSPEL